MRFVTVYLFSLLLVTQGALGQKKNIFVFPFEFKGLSAADAKRFGDKVAAVLASEAQAEIALTGRYNPTTHGDLESQLKKEQQKEKLKLDGGDDGIGRIFYRFGHSDAVFGTVTEVDGRFHITVSLSREEKVLTSHTGWSGKTLKDLIKQTRAVVRFIFSEENIAKFDLPTIYYELVKEAHALFRSGEYAESLDMLKAALKYNPESKSLPLLIRKLKKMNK